MTIQQIMNNNNNFQNDFKADLEYQKDLSNIKSSVERYFIDYKTVVINMIDQLVDERKDVPVYDGCKILKMEKAAKEDPEIVRCALKYIKKQAEEELDRIEKKFNELFNDEEEDKEEEKKDDENKTEIEVEVTPVSEIGDAQRNAASEAIRSMAGIFQQ